MRTQHKLLCISSALCYIIRPAPWCWCFFAQKAEVGWGAAYPSHGTQRQIPEIESLWALLQKVFTGILYLRRMDSIPAMLFIWYAMGHSTATGSWRLISCILGRSAVHVIFSFWLSYLALARHVPMLACWLASHQVILFAFLHGLWRYLFGFLTSLFEFVSLLCLLQ